MLTPAYIARLVAAAADHWLIHPSLILERGRACQEAAWSRFAIVRVLASQGWTKREIAEALGRESDYVNQSRQHRDRTGWVRHALAPKYETEEVRLLEAILREVPR